MRRLSLTLFPVAVVVWAVMSCALAPAADAAVSTVPVVACHTTFGVQGNPPTIPARLRTEGTPKMVQGLTAYTNYYTYLIGPSGLVCQGVVGADGSSTLSAWRRGRPRPGRHSTEAGLTLDQASACVGCIGTMLCPFLPKLADEIFPDVPCTQAVPSGETVQPVNANVVRFTDPPRVRGDGDPSGGQNAAHGADGYGGRRRGSFETACTLPASQRWVCTASVNDAIARYG
jgi:hypothetical protein